MRFRFDLCLIVAALHFGTATSPFTGIAGAAEIVLEPCDIAGVDPPVRCGRLRVPEDDRVENGRTLDLRVVVLSATGPDAAPDPLFVLQGGPGQGASTLAPFYAGAFAGIRARRDIVLVDQRGTGDSRPLECRLYGDDPPPQRFLGPELSLDAVRDCRDRLRSVADLGRYTTPVAMDDLDAVRAALGYRRINLYGTSYGSLAAQVYLRRHGRHVRAAILRAAVPIGGDWFHQYAPNTERALDRLLTLCVADARCHEMYGDLGQAVERIVERLAEAPAPFEAPDPQTGDVVRLELGLAAFSAAVRGHLSAPSFAARLPNALFHAAKGDFDAIGSVALMLRRGSANALAWGMFLSVACNELVGVDELVDVEGEASPLAWRHLDDGRRRGLVDACAIWPRAALPHRYFEPVRSDRPVLIVSGWLDPSTPPEGAAVLERTLTNSRHLVIRHAGHSFDNLAGCLDGILEQFIETAEPDAVDTSCADRIAMPPFLLD